MNFQYTHSRLAASARSLHLPSACDAVVDLPEWGVSVLDHQTVAAPANPFAIQEKPGAVAVLALVDAPARVLRVPVARHADGAEVKSVAFRLSRFCCLAELGAQAVRRRQVGLYFAANRADGCAIAEFCQGRAVRLTFLNLSLRRRNAQRLFQRERWRLGVDELLALGCRHAYRHGV